MYIDHSQVTRQKGGLVLGGCSVFITRRDTAAVITVSKEVFVKVGFITLNLPLYNIKE